MYGCFDNMSLVTLAPEMGHAGVMIEELTKAGICVSLGHTKSSLEEAIDGMHHGAICLTHLFNAMHAFHHRDPG